MLDERSSDGLGTLITHTAFVLVAVVEKNALWGTGAPWWKIDRVFRLVELPVTGPGSWLLQTLPGLPPWAAFGRLWIALAVSEFVVYGILGGAFYALLAAFIVFMRERKRSATEQPS